MSIMFVSFILAIKNLPSRSPTLSAPWITFPLSENAAHAHMHSSLETFFHLCKQSNSLSLSFSLSVAHQISLPFGDSWHLLIIRVFLIMV